MVEVKPKIVNPTARKPIVEQMHELIGGVAIANTIGIRRSEPVNFTTATNEEVQEPANLV